MAELLGVHEVRLDRRLDDSQRRAHQAGAYRTPALVVAQTRAPELPGTQSLAASAPGAVALNVGNCADVLVRLERWSERPPITAGGSTDRDELPWQEVIDGGPLSLGNDDDGGLDVDGLGRARVVVLARTARGGHDDEEWLLQLFPDPDHGDALAGPPRVLSGDPFVRPEIADPATVDASEVSAYHRGLQTVRGGGWHVVRHLGLQDLLTLFGIATAAVTREELESAMAYFPCPINSFDDVVFSPDWPDERWPGEVLAEDVSQLAAALEAAAGMAAIRTAGDSLECLLRLGVLVEEEFDDGSLRISPSETAPPIWAVVDLQPGWLVTLRASLLGQAFGTPRDDLLHLMRWSEAGVLSVTMRQLADRLALAPDLLRATVAMMRERGHLTTEQNMATIDDDTAFYARAVRWTAPNSIVEPEVPSIDHETLVEMLHELLTPDEASALLAYERPSARLVRVKADEPATAVLGGLPQLPADVEWPTLGDRPLYFLAGVDLAAVHEVHPDTVLPAAGCLNFFATHELPEDSFPFVSAMFPVSRAGWRVIYVPPGTATSERSYPDSAGDGLVPFRRVSCGLLPEATVPTPAFAAGREIDLEPGRLQAFLDARWRRVDRTLGPNHRIGGWADPAQSDPAAPVALADGGLTNAQGQVDHSHPDAARLVATADDDWYLLLQLATDDATGWMWGDGGVMFFYIQPDAARAGDFSNVWMNWDCS